MALGILASGEDARSGVRRASSRGQAVVVVKNRTTAPLKVALTISNAAPTAMKPTSNRIHELSRIRVKMPRIAAANPTIISSPAMAGEP